MKKNYKLCLRIESKDHLFLKQEAEKENLTLAQLCRRKLKEKSPAKIEFILENLNHKLNKILENGTK
jgi:hypothetical protein